MTARSTLVVAMLLLASACAPSTPAPAPAVPDRVPVPTSAAPPRPATDVHELLDAALAADAGRVLASSAFTIHRVEGTATAEFVWADGAGWFELTHDRGYAALGLAPRLALTTRLAGIDQGVELTGSALDAARRRVLVAMGYLVTGVPMVEESPGRWRGFPPGTRGFVAVTAHAGPAGLHELVLGVSGWGRSGAERGSLAPGR